MLRGSRFFMTMAVGVMVFGACVALDEEKGNGVVNIQETAHRLEAHLKALTVDIGERSVLTPENLRRAQEYIESAHRGIGLTPKAEPYSIDDLTVANVVAQIDFCDRPTRRYLVGAHYDSVAGTVGADDNAGGVAVQLEVARALAALLGSGGKMNLSVKFVSFALEEPPAFATPDMGSRVYAAKSRAEKEPLDGMICLEMVSYTCRKPGCQDYPFPLTFMNYPKEGNFIGIVGDFGSRSLTKALNKAFHRNPGLPVISLTVPFQGWLLPAVRLSDHASFWDEGFKAVMITDTAFYRNPFYHTQADTMDRLDTRFMAELVQSLATFFISEGRQ